MSGLPIVLSGPSGCGKTTISRLILDSNRDMIESVSYTTRPPRHGEESGVHYNFIDDAQFAEMQSTGGFLESANVHGFMYGTGALWVESELSRNRNVLFVLDINGGMALKQAVNAVTIFVVPPNLKSLQERLVRRGTDSDDIMQRRLASAPDEIRSGIDLYDYIVYNNKLEVALNDILSIIRTEHIIRRSRKDILNNLLVE